MAKKNKITCLFSGIGIGVLDSLLLSELLLGLAVSLRSGFDGTPDKNNVKS